MRINYLPRYRTLALIWLPAKTYLLESLKFSYKNFILQYVCPIYQSTKTHFKHLDQNRSRLFKEGRLIEGGGGGGGAGAYNSASTLHMHISGMT